MVRTRRSALLGSPDSSDVTKNTNTLPPRNAKRVARQRGQQYASIPSLPTGPFLTNTGNNTKQSSRRKSSSRRLHEKPPRSNTNRTQHEPSKANRHFLRGINLNNFQDPMSIPSPPSPGSSERLWQRRLSLSFLSSEMATPLQDTTNIHASSPLVKKNVHIGSKERNRKRRSLCHVPSPLEDGGELQPPTKKQSPENQKITHASNPLVLDDFNDKDVRVRRRSKKRSRRRETLLLQPGSESKQAATPPPPQHLDLAFFDDEEEGLVDRSKKPSRKRRQSLLLPSESLESLDIATEALGTRTKTNEGSAQTIRPHHDEANLDFSRRPNLAELQKLVRGYCSLHAGTEHRTQCADSIKEQTGYALCRSDVVDHNEATDPEVMRNQKKALLIQIGPSVQQMEEEKVSQAKEAELSTGCKVERKSGKYRYRDATGKKVSCDEYKVRYAAMIARKKQEKAKMFQLIREQLESSSSNPTTKCPPEALVDSCAENAEAVLPAASASAAHQEVQCGNDDMDCDETDMLFEHATPQSTRLESSSSYPTPAFPLKTLVGTFTKNAEATLPTAAVSAAAAPKYIQCGKHDMDYDETDLLFEHAAPQSAQLEPSSSYPTTELPLETLVDTCTKDADVANLTASVSAATALKDVQYGNNDMDCDNKGILFEHATLQSNHSGTSMFVKRSTSAFVHESFLPLQMQVKDTEAATKEPFVRRDTDTDLGAASNPCTTRSEHFLANRVSKGAPGEELSKEQKQEAFNGLCTTGSEQLANRVRKEAPAEEESQEEKLEGLDVLLSLPSREEESENEDPEIAQAREKLYHAIDTALETYSMEVMAIQERKKAASSRN